MSEATWLPNLVGGTSIWKLAIDLNEPKFFDGRLLVPETEGSESLPVTVRWDLTGLIPLGEARTAYPDESATAIKDFQACLERVAKVFATPNSGFDKYKDAFTVPSLEAGNGTNYFYSVAKKKLFVINWGASPRSMGGKAEYVFGFADWAKEWGPPTIAGAAAAIATGAALKNEAPAAAAVVPAKDDKKEEKKDEKKEKGRPWWLWPLFGLVVIILILVALFLLRACEEQKLANGADAALDAPAEGASSADGAAAGEAGVEAGAVDASDDASAQGDAGDASTDGDAGALADGGDAGRDGGRRDGGPAGDDDDDDDGPTGSSGGVGSSGGGGPIVVKVFPGGGTKTSVHRKHYSDDAVAWRVSGATTKVSRTEDSGKRFDVWLAPGQTFEGVKVEWQDKAGKWHVH